MKKIPIHQYLQILLTLLGMLFLSSATISQGQVVVAATDFDVFNKAASQINTAPGVNGTTLNSPDNTILTTTVSFAASSYDKLVVSVSGRAFASVTSMTYGGQALTEAAQVTSSQMTAAIFYLDSFGVTDGDLVVNFSAAAMGDTTSIMIFGLTGTAAGAPATTASDSDGGAVTMPLLAAGSDSFLLGAIGSRSPNTAAGSESPVGTATYASFGNSRGTGGYFTGTTAGSTYNITNTDTNSLNRGVFVEFKTDATTATVPNVVGLAQATAESNITGAGFTVGTVTTAYSASVPLGDVISQNPAGGVEAFLGSSVDLVVSLGPPPPVNVPDVVGLDQATAESTITGANLTVGTLTFQNDALVDAGNVISQTPTAGSTVDTGSSVDLVVSLGPQPTVPDVVDLPQATALSDITTATLTVGTVSIDYSSTIAAGNVISQSPAAGVSVDTGSSVDLVVSIGPNPAPGTIADFFTFHADCATLAEYSANPGADVALSDNFGADNPITISTTGFTAVGTDKLVAVISLHNSAVSVAPVTGLTYGGENLIPVTGNLEGTNGTKNAIYYLDNVATDGDLVITFDDTTLNIDEVGVQLFALNGLEPGTAYASESKGSGAFTPVNAVVGDFLVAVAQRNNGAGTIFVTNNPPYSEFDLTKGNLTSRVGYQVPSASGSTAPEFAGTVQYESFAAFAATGTHQGSPYDDWAATNAPTTGDDPSADEDGDGVTNGVEFVVGGIISTNDLGKLPAVGDDGTNMTFTFERDQDSIDASVSVDVEVGTDLSTWPASYTVGADTGNSDAGVTVSKDDPGAGTDTVTLTVVKSPDAKKFARLKVIITP